MSSNPSDKGLVSEAPKEAHDENGMTQQDAYWNATETGLGPENHTSTSNNKTPEGTTITIPKGGSPIESQIHYVQMDDDDYANKIKEEDDDNQSLSVSIVSSVLTADGISDPSGFAIVCLVVLIGDMSRGVMFPTLWPLVASLGGTKVTQGYAVAAFSFGRILVSPIFGSWSVTHGYTKTLLFSCSILFLGTLLYAQVPNVGHPSFLIFAQTMLGVGSGTLGVTRAFVAEVTPKRNRTTYIAWLTAVQYAGFTVSPFVGAIFSHIFQDEDRVIQKGFLLLNAYTVPAYFMGGVVLITLFLLLTLFQDRQRHGVGGKKASKSRKRNLIDELANSKTICSLTVYDACILGCMLLNIATKGSIACFETLGIAIAEAHFDLHSSEAGFIVSSCGTLGVIALLSMGYIAQYLSDIQMITYGMGIMAIGIASLSFLEDEIYNPTWRYVVAIFMIYSVGYPIGHTAVIGLFSKIIGRRPQGTLLGWFASAGSFARITFPIMSGYVSHFVGFTTLFIIVTCILGMSIIFTVFSGSTLLLLSS